VAGEIYLLSQLGFLWYWVFYLGEVIILMQMLIIYHMCLIAYA